jgi:TatA/E family protein of Tat protein translocase
MIFIFVLALLIFGPRKLPELGRSLGKALTEFRRASADLRNVVEEEMREMERQTAEVKRAAEDLKREAEQTIMPLDDMREPAAPSDTTSTDAPTSRATDATDGDAKPV